jgi:hypothetical protein
MSSLPSTRTRSVAYAGPGLLAILTLFSLLALGVSQPASAATNRQPGAASADAKAALGYASAPKTGDTTYRTAEGRWVSAACEPTGPVAFTRDFVLEDKTWALVAPFYADVDCTVPLFTVLVGGDYRLLGPSKEAEGARKARFFIGYRQIIPMQQGIADAMTVAGCGDTISFVGVATDILQTGCAPFGLQSQTACPVEHDLLMRDGDRLFFGERPADQRGLCSSDRQATTLTPPLVLG